MKTKFSTQEIEQKFQQATIIFEQGNLEQAKEEYEEILNHQPEHFYTIHMLGVLYAKLENYQLAIELISKAIAIYPKRPSFYFNLAKIFENLKDYPSAISNYDKAIILKPDYASAHYSLGIIFLKFKGYLYAIKKFEKVLSIDSNFNFALGYLFDCKMMLCNWNEFESNVLELTQKIEDNQSVCPPFTAHSLINSLPIIKKSTTLFSDLYPYNLSMGSIKKYPKSNKIRIGYFSSDFYNHAVSILIAEVFELHDKNQFEIIAFAFGPDIKDDLHKRVSVAFDQFIDVRTKSDKEVAELAREMQINIAVDLNGYTTNNRTNIFAFGAAPIQLSYIGFLGTMSARYYQYLIADQTLIPDESQNHYSEKIIYLPSYQANDSKRQISEKIFTREELNLPKEGFVYCCFNSNYKILPSTFDSWMRILKAVPKSVFFIYCDNEIVKENLIKEAKKREVNSDRIIFSQRLSNEENLSRYRVADLFLDTFPYNAGATASDALWAGLPVLTHIGETFSSRIAASLLNAIEMPELITTSQEEYEKLAIELGNNPYKIKELKNKLNKNRLTTKLFNSKLFTKNLETAYKKIYQRYQDDLQPDHIYI